MQTLTHDTQVSEGRKSAFGRLSEVFGIPFDASKQVQTEKVFCTPQLASTLMRFVDFTTIQRTSYHSTIEHYATMMRRGQFRASDITINYCEETDSFYFANGRHRMLAMERAAQIANEEDTSFTGVEVFFTVKVFKSLKDIQHDVNAAYDHGKSRNRTDDSNFAGINELLQAGMPQKVDAATGRTTSNTITFTLISNVRRAVELLVMGLEDYRNKPEGLAPQEITELHLSLMPELQAAIPYAVCHNADVLPESLTPLAVTMREPTTIAAMVITLRAQPEKAHEFWSGILKGTNGGNAILRSLYEVFTRFPQERKKKGKMRWTERDLLDRIIEHWNAFFVGKESLAYTRSRKRQPVFFNGTVWGAQGVRTVLAPYKPSLIPAHQPAFEPDSESDIPILGMKDVITTEKNWTHDTLSYAPSTRLLRRGKGKGA